MITDLYPFVFQQGANYVVEQKAEFSQGIKLRIKVHVVEMIDASLQ
jgi:hypothetical protein